jgi:hypothetical protein
MLADKLAEAAEDVRAVLDRGSLDEVPEPPIRADTTAICERDRRVNERWSMRLVNIATYSQVAEAYMAKHLLEAEGIEASLADEESGAAVGYAHGPSGAVKLQVPEGQAERSTAILKAAKGRQ